MAISREVFRFKVHMGTIMGFTHLSHEEIVRIVFDTEGLSRPQKTKLKDREKELRHTGVYFRMHTLWSALCDILNEKHTLPFKLSSAKASILRHDGNSNNGEKKFFIEKLTKHFARLEAAKKAKKTKNKLTKRDTVLTARHSFCQRTS